MSVESINQIFQRRASIFSAELESRRVSGEGIEVKVAFPGAKCFIIVSINLISCSRAHTPRTSSSKTFHDRGLSSMLIKASFGFITAREATIRSEQKRKGKHSTNELKMERRKALKSESQIIKYVYISLNSPFYAEVASRFGKAKQASNKHRQFFFLFVRSLILNLIEHCAELRHCTRLQFLHHQRENS